jgi:hypothetical protein
MNHVFEALWKKCGQKLYFDASCKKHDSVGMWIAFGRRCDHKPMELTDVPIWISS